MRRLSRVFTKNPPEAAHLQKLLSLTRPRGGDAVHVITGNPVGMSYAPLIPSGLPDVLGLRCEARQASACLSQVRHQCLERPARVNASAKGILTRDQARVSSLTTFGLRRSETRSATCVPQRSSAWRFSSEKLWR